MNESVSGSHVCGFADIEILRYAVPHFESLSLQNKLFVYHLGRAAIAGRDIFVDQNGSLHLMLQTWLEAIYVHYRGNRSDVDFVALADYTHRFWFANGVYHHYGEHKFKPSFSESFFRSAVESVMDFLPQTLVAHLDEVCRLIFDPTYLPIRTSADTDTDMVRTSAVNYYQGVSCQEAEDYYAARRQEYDAPTSPGLNTKLIKEHGRLKEEKWCSSGGYGAIVRNIMSALQDARPYAACAQQQESIDLLIEYYRDGELKIFDQYNIGWVTDTESPIDFINGFIETYQDPLGLKGSWEGLVQIRDHTASERTRLLSSNAWWFEAHAPIAPAYRKEDPQGISASVVHTAMLGGDAYPATPIGINLPNADAIRTTYGSKSVTIENIHDAYDRASRRSGMDEAFVPDYDIRMLLQRYGSETDRLHTDLHECLGHGSGRLAPNVSAEALGPWHATIEEARADLFALYFLADDKMLHLGLLSSPEAYQAAYYRYMLNGLVTQLVRIQPGGRIEEAHMRNRALIARYVLSKAEPLHAMRLDGIELQITDYGAIRDILASLLREVQRIKSQGDISAAEALIKTYAIEVPQDLHSQVLQRYESLHLAPYRGFVNPRYFRSYDQEANITDIRIDYTESYDVQMLRYSRMYAAARWTTINSRHDTPTDNATDKKDLIPSFEALSSEDQAAAKQLRTSLRHRMDGVVATSMRRYGLNHKVNFGVTRTHLNDLSSTIKPSAPLARYLFGRNVRELRLLALRIFPAHELKADEAFDWATKAEDDVELRNELPALLLDRVPQAATWALGWIERGAHTLCVAFITLARAITRATFVPIQTEQALLITRATEALALENEWQANAAALLLKRLSRLSPEVSAAVQTTLELYYATDKRHNIEEYRQDITCDSNNPS